MGDPLSAYVFLRVRVPTLPSWVTCFGPRRGRRRGTQLGSVGTLTRKNTYAEVGSRVSGPDGAAGEGPNLVASELLHVKIRMRRGGHVFRAPTGPQARDPTWWRRNSYT